MVKSGRGCEEGSGRWELVWLDLGCIELKIEG